MKKALTGIVAAAWILLTLTPGVMAESVDPLKSLKIGIERVMQTRQASEQFQFGSFTVNPGQGDDLQSWNVDLTTTQPISGNRWLVKTVFQDRAGADLFSGEDILLPAGHAGKVYRLTRSFRKDPRLATIVFHVFNQEEVRIAATQSYQVAAGPSYGAMGTAAPDRPAIPGKASDPAVKIDTTLDVSFIPDPENPDRFSIRNNSTFNVKINEIFAVARFLAADRKMSVQCDHSDIKPAQATGCKWWSYDQVKVCPALTAVDIEALINGITHHHRIPLFDPSINEIPKDKPVVRLEKKHTWKGLQWGSTGTATIIIRGSYVRIGTCVTMKGLASVDSGLFPVVFRGVQQEDGIHAGIIIRGETAGKPPDRFCFNLMEITTCDDLDCGGVGVLLYRNTYIGDYQQGGMNQFLEYQVCE